MSVPSPDGSLTRHRSVGSQITNASGISYASSLATNESLHLSSFPSPPPSMPASPLRHQFPASSAGGSHTLTPPATPTTLRLHPTSPLIPRRHDAEMDALANKPPAYFRSRPLPTPRGPPVQTNNSSPAPSTISGGPLSPYDWHEGSSSIGIDPSEDRLLSTTFITTLLSSTDESTDENGARNPPRREVKRSTRQIASETDAMSGFSEMTYPPPSRVTQSPTPEYYSLHHPSHTSVFRNSQSNGQQTQSIDQALSFMTSSDSESYSGVERNSALVVRTASVSRLGSPGASVVGMVPATLRKVSGQRGMTDSRSIASGPDVDFRGSEGSSANLLYQESRNLPEFAQPRTASFGPALPSTAGTQMQGRFPRRQSRQSAHSTRSTKSYVSSLISRFTATSGRSARQAVTWLRKPLPPVPILPNMPISVERAYRNAESNMPLPELASRARRLSQLLEKGYHPHQSIGTMGYEAGQGKINGAVYTTGTDMEDVMNLDFKDAAPDPPQSDGPKVRLSNKKKRAMIIALICLLVAVVVGISVGVTVGRSKSSKPPTCSGNLTGMDCSLDATCVCISSTDGQCLQLAQNLVTLTPSMNTLFGADFSAGDVANALWLAQGSPTGSNCASQSLLTDVAPALNGTTSPNRTTWVQSALLWNLVQSQDLSAVSKMRNFVVSADWAKAGSADGPVSDASSSFSIDVSGFGFDFEAQTVTEPTKATFVGNGQPSSAQIAEVDSTAEAALDRMYTFALASSTQRQKALSNYWQAVLQQKPQDLATFMSIVSVSPILLPFDAISSPGAHPLANLLNSTTGPFPPPLACYPGLNSTELSTVNNIETSIFGLSQASSTSNFDTSCFPNRPIYGILDLLQLRLPFPESQTGAPRQAIVLSRDVIPRAIVYNGEILSSLPTLLNTSTPSTSQKDPWQYGTLNNFNHVMLNYLTSISDINLAMALVKFILSSSATPPPSSSPLFSSLASLPTLEVAVFGTVSPSDVSSVFASFTNPDGSLFFGSDQGMDLRQWAIKGAGQSVVWAQNATSSEVVRDASLTDQQFMEVWTPASEFLHVSNPAASGIVVNVDNITSSFQSLGKFSP